MERRDFLLTTATGIIGACGLSAACAASGSAGQALASIDPGDYDGSWWNRKPFRLIQTNLREIDAMTDIDAYVRFMVESSANIVLLNVGGIVANYPTELEYHYRNPFMQGDFVGEMTEALHAAGIRVMARFDFSKVNEAIARQKPEWLYVSPIDGPYTDENRNVNYNGQVHTCAARGYQQEYCFLILEEALTKYPVDGVFFNMTGFTTSDYSGNQYGYCVCPDCQRLFGPGSTRTRQEVAAELFTRTHEFIRQVRPDICISTYTTVGVDMVSTESSSSVSTAHEWNYSATDHTKRTRNSYRDLMPMNLLIGFQDIGFRHVATSPNIARVWQLQNLIHAGTLNYVFIGPGEKYQDRAYVPILQDIYRFHKENEPLFTNAESAGTVALIQGQTNEYRGLIKLLSEHHIIYDVISPAVIGSDRLPRQLEEYDAVILGDVRNLPDDVAAAIDRYVSNGGKLLATGYPVRLAGGGGGPGASALANPGNTIQFECLGVEPQYEYFRQAKSTYLNVTAPDKAFIGERELADYDLLMCYSDFLKVRMRQGARGGLSLIPETRFGPPEKNYYTEDEITDFPGIVYNEYGNGKSVFLPWGLGAQYYAKGHHAHNALFGAIVRNVLRQEALVETDAPALIEVSHIKNRAGAFEWVGLLNHTGQIGPALGAPVPIYDVTVRLRPAATPREVVLLRSGRSVRARHDGSGWLEVVVPEVKDFEMVVCLY